MELLSFLLVIIFASHISCIAANPSTPCRANAGCHNVMFDKAYPVTPFPTRLFHYCEDIVTYPYYQKQNSSQVSIEADVRSILGADDVFLLDNQCQIYAKRLVCGLKFPMSGFPFIRVCKSLCRSALGDLAAQIPASCPLLAASFSKMKINCNSLLPAPLEHFPMFDIQSSCNTADFANPAPFLPTTSNFPPNTPHTYTSRIAQAEPYWGSTCKNIIPSDELIFIPPAKALSIDLNGNGSITPAESFVNLQPMKVVQDLIEAKIAPSLSALFKAAPFMSSECHFAMRKYFCGQGFMKSNAITLGDAMKAKNPNNLNYSTATSFASFAINNYGASSALNLTFKSLYNYKTYFPSLPHKDICLEYQDKCESFINAVPELERVALKPNCDDLTKWATGPVPLKATLPMTLMGIPNLIPALLFVTSPNTMSKAVDKDSSGEPYETKCPGNFVVPDDPEDPLVQWIPSTGCAVPCKRNVWTASEWAGLNATARIVPSVGIVCITALLVMWVLDKNRRKKQYLVCFFAGTSFVATLFFNFMSDAKVNDPNLTDTSLCKNNAVQLTAHDGSTICAAQAVVMTYSALGCCLSWLMQSLDLFLKINLEYSATDTEKLFWYQVAVVFGLPLIPAIYVISNNLYGFGGNLPWCFMSVLSGDNDDLWLFYIPIFVITVIGFVAMVSVITKMIVMFHKAHTSGSSGGLTKFVASLSLLKIPFLFVSFFLIVWVSLFSYRAQTYEKQDLLKESYVTWIMCVFSKWDGVSDESWRTVCGAHLEHRVHFNLAQWISLCASGQSILVACIFLFNPKLEFPSDLHWFIRTVIPPLAKYLPVLKSSSSNTRSQGDVSEKSDSKSWISSNKSKVYVDEVVELTPTASNISADTVTNTMEMETNTTATSELPTTAVPLEKGDL